MLVVDGTFEEQIEELATYIDSLAQGDSQVQKTVEEALAEGGDPEAAIDAVVTSSDLLLSTGEKEFESTHNLLIHVVLSAKDLDVYLPTLLKNLRQVPAFPNGSLTTYNILTTLFNVADPQYRLPIFQTLLDICVEHKIYDPISPKFKIIAASLKEWDASPENARAVYAKIFAIADAADPEGRHTEFLIRAIESFTAEDDSKDLTVKTVNAALNEPNRFTVDDLLLLPSVRALEQNSPAHFQLLSQLSSGSFSDLQSFNASNSSFYSTNSVSEAIIEHKFKVLTVAALAARQDNRKLRYSDVASALEIPIVDVEMWIIETIKSGLVEGKLSQPSATFLVHRATYRTFEHEQWEEVSAKLASWKESLHGILEVIDNVQNSANGGQQLVNGFADEDEDESRSQAHSEIASVDENAD